MGYNRQGDIEEQIEQVAAALTDGIEACEGPLDSKVVDRAKRWLAWMVDVTLLTSIGWKPPTSMERTCEGEFGFLWETGERVLYVVVSEKVGYFCFDGHPLWGDADDGDATDAAAMKTVWEAHWARGT